MKVTAQEKIAELEGRIAQLEKQVANMRHRTGDEFDKKHQVGRYGQGPRWLVEMCDVFFNGRPA